MTIQEIQQEILRMKKEQDVCILAHAYQGQEILEVADYMERLLTVMWRQRKFYGKKQFTA